MIKWLLIVAPSRKGTDVDDAWAHRVIMRRAHLGNGTTLLLLSLCLVTSVGLTGENMVLLEYVGSPVGRSSEPFLIGLDWNACPELFLETKWVDQIGVFPLALDARVWVFVV